MPIVMVQVNFFLNSLVSSDLPAPMAEMISSPAKKRYGMVFRRRSPSETIITAQFPDPSSGRLSPNNGSIASSQAYTSRSDPLPYTTSPPPPPPPPHQRQPIERAQSSEYFLQIQRRQPAQEAQSRRSRFNTTIYTDATETQPAFESDAFAVEMPTARDPVLETPVFRTKLPKFASPSKAQAEAYQTYKEKAQQVRERNNSTGVRVPSKIVSYDYARARKDESSPESTPLQKYIDSMTPSSPPRYPRSTAGSFPASPPIPQTSWSTSKTHIHDASPTKIQGPRSIRTSNTATDALGNIRTSSSTTRPTTHHGHSLDCLDTDTGATHTTPTPATAKTAAAAAEAKATITVRLKPKPSAAAATPRTSTDQGQQQQRPRKDSHQPDHDSPRTPSRSPSPPNPPPRSIFATNTAANQADTVPGGDVVFGHTHTNTSHTTAGSTPSTADTATHTPPHASTPPTRKERQHPTPTKASKTPHHSILPRKWHTRLHHPSRPRVAKLIPPSFPSPSPPSPRPSSSPLSTSTSTPLPPPTLSSTTPFFPTTKPKPKPPNTNSPPETQIQIQMHISSTLTRLTTFLRLALKCLALAYVLVLTFYVLDAVRGVVVLLGWGLGFF